MIINSSQDQVLNKRCSDYLASNQELLQALEDESGHKNLTEDLYTLTLSEYGKGQNVIIDLAQLTKQVEIVSTHNLTNQQSRWAGRHRRSCRPSKRRPCGYH